MFENIETFLYTNIDGCFTAVIVKLHLTRRSKREGDNTLFFFMKKLPLSILFFLLSLVSCARPSSPPIVLSISSLSWNASDDSKVDSEIFTIELTNGYHFGDIEDSSNISSWFSNGETQLDNKTLSLNASTASESKLTVAVVPSNSSLLGTYSITIPKEKLKTSKGETPDEDLICENIIEFKLGIASIKSITASKNDENLLRNLTIEFEGAKCLDPFTGDKTAIGLNRTPKGSSGYSNIGASETIEIVDNASSLLFKYTSSSFNNKNDGAFEAGDKIELTIDPPNPSDSSKPTRFKALTNYKLPESFEKTVTLTNDE